MPIYGPKQGVAFNLYLPLLTAGTRDWLAGANLGYGTFTVSKNGGTEAAISGVIELSPPDGYWVKIPLSATEMSSPVVQVRGHDVAGQWDDTGEVIYTTSQGSGSGVVATLSTTAFIDPNELANLLVTPLANALTSTFNWLTASEIQQMRYALGLSGSTTATTGTGILDLVYDAVNTLSFTGSNVGAVVNSFSTAAQADIRTQVYTMLSEAGKTLAQLSGVPSATPTVAECLMAIFMALRNGGTQSATSRTFRDTSGSTIASQTITDNGTSITVGKWT